MLMNLLAFQTITIWFIFVKIFFAKIKFFVQYKKIDVK